jgi:hypothetical protein
MRGNDSVQGLHNGADDPVGNAQGNPNEKTGNKKSFKHDSRL